MTRTSKPVAQAEVQETKTQSTFDNEKRIVLWKNEQATNDNNQPLVRGNVTIDGKLYYISLWSQKDKNGNVFWNGKVRKADEMVNATNETLPF